MEVFITGLEKGDILIQVTMYKLFACFIAYISTSLSENYYEHSCAE
jgi:hypothetical protein